MRIHTFTALVACLIIVVSCEKNGDGEGACGAGYENAFAGGPSDIFLLVPFTGSHSLVATYFNYTGGSPNQVQFFVGNNIKGICTSEHMKIDYKVKFANVPQSTSMKIVGDAYWSAFSDEIILFNGFPTPGQTYVGSLTIGLKQAFPQGAANVDLFVNVEFVSNGRNLSLDSTYFVKHVELMEITSKYSKF